MKITNQSWTLVELFDEVLKRAETGENIKEIAFSDKFRSSHFTVLRAFVEAINNQENHGNSQRKIPIS